MLLASGSSPIPRMARARNVLDDLRLTHKVLKRLKIPHALIGGWATVAWGAVRATKDLDLLVLIGADDREPLKAAFERLEYEGEWRRGGIDDPIPELLRMTPRKEGMRPAIDFLPASKGFDYDAINRAVMVRLGQMSIPVVCREDLIAMKLSSGGGLDFQDVQAILDIHGKALDQELLENACRRLKVSQVLARIWKKS